MTVAAMAPTLTETTAPLRPQAKPEGAPGRATPEDISRLVGRLAETMSRCVHEIATVNEQTRVLSLNAQIEAMRAGEAGAAFAVVARSMQELSGATRGVAQRMAVETSGSIGKLQQISEILAGQVRGERLSDLALTNIDLVDRNLYERSCDVRWWATDASLVDALTARTPEAFDYASRRMAVILSAYTVYLDLVLCDTEGRVVANGRPHEYRSVGGSQIDAPWFRAAMATRSGEEFGFQNVHNSSLVSGQRTLVYSCCVREGAEAHGKPLGVLGVVFNWDGLSLGVLEKTPIAAEEKARTRCLFVDDSGTILADTGGQTGRTLEFSGRSQLFEEKKSFITSVIGGKPTCVAHGRSPGYETYATGWRSLVMQTLDG